MNKIVFELCEEDRARLDAIIAGLDGAKHDCSKCVGDAITIMQGNAADPVKPCEEEETAPEQDFTPEEKPEPVSLAEFQKAITMRCAASPEVKKAVKALVNKYAEKVTDVPEDKRSEILTELERI